MERRKSACRWSKGAEGRGKAREEDSFPDTHFADILPQNLPLPAKDNGLRRIMELNIAFARELEQREHAADEKVLAAQGQVLELAARVAALEAAAAPRHAAPAPERPSAADAASMHAN